MDSKCEHCGKLNKTTADQCFFCYRPLKVEHRPFIYAPVEEETVHEEDDDD